MIKKVKLLSEVDIFLQIRRSKPLDECFAIEWDVKIMCFWRSKQN